MNKLLKLVKTNWYKIAAPTMAVFVFLVMMSLATTTLMALLRVPMKLFFQMFSLGLMFGLAYKYANALATWAYKKVCNKTDSESCDSECNW